MTETIEISPESLNDIASTKYSAKAEKPRTSPKKGRTAVLEEKISELETRIAKLERVIRSR